jgi:hypothetical protein
MYQYSQLLKFHWEVLESWTTVFQELSALMLDCSVLMSLLSPGDEFEH